MSRGLGDVYKRQAVTDEQVSTILKVLFHRGDTKRLVAQVLTENRKEDTE